MWPESHEYYQGGNPLSSAAVDAPRRNGVTLFHWSTWRDFLRDQPGYRFRKLNERKRGNREGCSCYERWINILAGFCVALLGLALVFAPGPGSLVLAIGLAFLGAEFEGVARFMDTAEARVRSGASEFRRRWSQRDRVWDGTTLDGGESESIAVRADR